VQRANLASAGLGLLVQSSFGLQGSLYWARLLPGAGDPSAGGNRQRWEISLRQAF
jgi:hypothetical protein